MAIDMERFKRKNPILHKGTEVMMFIFTYAGENNLETDHSYHEMQTDGLTNVAVCINNKDFVKLRCDYGPTFTTFLLQYFIAIEDYENCQELIKQMDCYSHIHNLN